MSTQQITYVGFQLGVLVKALVSKKKKEEEAHDSLKKFKRRVHS